VLPHEETHPKAKADRLLLMRATQTNPEPIYGLYEDPDQTVARLLETRRAGLAPMLEAVTPTEVTPAGEQHYVYRYTDPALVTTLEAFFAPRRIWIADGHHRYETALNYSAEEPVPSATPSPRRAILIGLSAFEDPGLVVLPTHRLIKNLPASRLATLPQQLEQHFQVQEMTVPEARAWIKTETPGAKRFALLQAQRAYALTLRDLNLMDTAAESGHCDAWRRLDVSILQTLVLDRALGIPWKALAHTPDVAYTRDEEEAAQKVASGEFQMAALLQNPTVTEVRDVASAGDKMPQKSTFFYPKLWSGLILRSLK
jgi:uncharacterized protein (DUF1015 family)